MTTEAIAGLDGRGCYVYVEVKDDKITIKQDLNGSWGIYLFRHDDYFALSNSFFRLVDHVKFKYPLTLNRDYCHYLLTCGLCNQAYLETAVNEIQLIERNAVIYIDVAKKNLQIELIDYKEQKIALDSQEAMDTLNRWLEFWVGILNGIAQHTKFIKTDLSGGFDSRLAFVNLINSGIDYHKASISSINAPAYKEDYEIATQIATHYGFELNTPVPKNEFLNYSLTDIWNSNLYQRQTIHKVLCMPRKGVDKVYSLNGYGGETIRHYWYDLPTKFIEWTQYKLNKYSRLLSPILYNSSKNIIERAFNEVRDKYKIKDAESPYIPQFYYQETRCRHHFGKFALDKYFSNEILLSPLLDPEIRTLQLETKDCSDPNLLSALIFSRFAPDLLTFPFQGNRAIAPETIEYAKKINERFPCKDVAIATGGGNFICSRVIKKRNKFSLKVRTIKLIHTKYFEFV